MSDPREKEALDELSAAGALYERYVELARLTQIPIVVDEDATAVYQYGLDRPMGLTITHT